VSGTEAEAVSGTESDSEAASDSASEAVTASESETAPAPVRARRAPRTVSRVERLTRRAFAALRAGDPGRAVRLAESAIAADPARSGAYVALAGAHDALGDGQASRMAFRRCVAQATDAMASTCRSLAR
jgi:Tfp pilus assembly protein PilF